MIKISKPIHDFFVEIWDSMSKSTKECEVFFVPFGYLLVIGYLGFYWFNLLIAAPTGYENFPMRLMISTIGMGLILKKYWLHYIEKFMPIYWYITLIYSLPFFFSFMLFNNPDSNIWQINGLVGAVTLTFFVDWMGYIILILIGIALSYLFFYIEHGHGILPPSLLGVLGSYSAPIIYLVLFSRKRKQAYQDKLLAEEKAFNTKLLKQSSDLRKALSIKSDFLSNISHEVRTPINGVVNISELLVDHWHEYSEDERYKNMKIIAQSGNRLLMLMNNILDLSKFESGKVSINIIRGNLAKLVEDMVTECNMLYLNNKDITIETYIQPDLDTNIDMDSEKITQVLRNLMGNAIKFTESGKVTVSLQRQGDNLEVIVKDEGIGIPESELEEIFDSFVQSSRTKNKAGGTGLGLAICKETVLAHKGKIWAKNNPNKGSSFHFLLPKPHDTASTKSRNRKLDKSRVLVIDDEETSHNVLSLILRAEGCQIISVYSGAEGLEYLRTQNIEDISFVLLDLMMPDMYGMNVLKEIKKDKALENLPVIMQSASDDPHERTQAVELGASNFLKKPYNRREIVSILVQYRSED